MKDTLGTVYYEVNIKKKRRLWFPLWETIITLKIFKEKKKTSEVHHLMPPFEHCHRKTELSNST